MDSVTEPQECGRIGCSKRAIFHLSGEGVGIHACSECREYLNQEMKRMGEATVHEQRIAR